MFWLKKKKFITRRQSIGSWKKEFKTGFSTSFSFFSSLFFYLLHTTFYTLNTTFHFLHTTLYLILCARRCSLSICFSYSSHSCRISSSFSSLLAGRGGKSPFPPFFGGNGGGVWVVTGVVRMGGKGFGLRIRGDGVVLAISEKVLI